MTRLILTLSLCLLAGAVGAHPQQAQQQPGAGAPVSDRRPPDTTGGERQYLPPQPAPPRNGAGARAPAQGDYRANVSPQTQPPLPWLDAVRAQREIWEEKRRANKAAIDARRRRIDPWGAARQDAREEEVRRRREARKDEVARNRNVLRNRGARTPPRDPFYQGPRPPSPEPAQDSPDHPSPAPAYPPSGWDNPWYYQGH